MISIFEEMWAPPKSKDSLELTRLYRNIEEGLQRRPGSSVAITSAQHTDQVLRLSYDLAWVGSTLLGKRVLVLDAAGSAPRPTARAWTPPRPEVPPPRPAVDGTLAEPAPKQALMEVDRALRERSNVGLLSLRVSPGAGTAVVPQVTEIWAKLQTTFDLIIVATPPVLDDPTASCLGATVDGNVLVVSSGRSRQKDVSRAIELLSAGMAPLIGVVMTDRRHTFPRWLRRLFRAA